MPVHLTCHDDRAAVELAQRLRSVGCLVAQLGPRLAVRLDEATDDELAVELLFYLRASGYAGRDDAASAAVPAASAVRVRA